MKVEFVGAGLSVNVNVKAKMLIKNPPVQESESSMGLYTNDILIARV